MPPRYEHPSAALQRPDHYAPLSAPPLPAQQRVLRDVIAGFSIAGLLLPEAVAYAGIASLPPQAGLIALLSGLVVYALIGSSRFAIVSATSSSAAVLFATVLSEPGNAGTALTLASALIIATGLLFILAGVGRLGGMSDFIARPVLRGFTFGLALTIAIKQLPKILDVAVHHSDTPRVALDLLSGAASANPYSTTLGAVALALLFGLGRWGGRIPATLVVIVLAIAAGYWLDWHAYGIAVVGHIDLQNISFGVPDLGRAEWMQSIELGFALMLILYAESYGSIRNFALKHGDGISANRDLTVPDCAAILPGGEVMQCGADFASRRIDGTIEGFGRKRDGGCGASSGCAGSGGDGSGCGGDGSGCGGDGGGCGGDGGGCSGGGGGGD